MPKSSATSSVYGFDQLAASIAEYETRYKNDITAKEYFGFPMATVLDAESRLLSRKTPSTAYFSMEFGIAPSIYNSFTLSRPMNPQNQFFTHDVFSNYWLCDYLFKIQTDKLLDIPIYGGGLGVLAGDTMKSAADLAYSLVGIGVLWNKGYFKQKFWYKHGQIPEELTWDPFTYPGLIPLDQKVAVDTREGPLHLRLWKYYIYSYDKRFACPLILLDSNLPENSEHFRKLTDQLYRADHAWWKIFQRSILGIGGMKALKLLGYSIDCFHLNEGHAAFALLEKYIEMADKKEMEEFRKKCVFTCHTPVAAGHDRFSLNDVRSIFTQEYIDAADTFGKEDPNSDMINLTYLSLNNCHKVNAVAQKHGEVMRIQFPGYAEKIDAITNGIHTHTWISSHFQALFDQYGKVFGDWRRDPKNLTKIEDLRDDQAFRKDLFEAHLKNKSQLIQLMKNWRLKPDVFTLGWARRIAGYKRPGLIFHDIDRLIKLAENFGKIQIILAGKAHPNDDIGSAHIDEILDHIDDLNQHHKMIKVMILENYDTYFGKLLTNSVDVWLNNPLPPFEASGTSGMKAIVNGVLQVSTYDGWVVEAAEHDIGWIFGYRHEGQNLGKESELRLDEDSRALCDTLQDVMKLYYETHANGTIRPESAWIDKMINCISQSAFFSTQRMVQEYNLKMWGFPPPAR